MRCSAVLSVVILIGGPALAGDQPPIPRAKPARQDVAVNTPLPRPKPSRDTAGISPSQSGAPSLSAKDWPGQGEGWPSDAVDDARAACGPLLEGQDITYKPLPPIGREGGCGTPAPVEVTAIAGVSIDPPAIMNCTLAHQLHGWIVNTVQPAAKSRLKTQVTGIHNASSYVCRGRNGLKGGKLSEHGKANALDMSGFSFARSDSVTVEDGWGGLLQSIGLSKNGSFLGTIRSGACDYFTTVLGPGSDAYHGDHFHVDALARRGGYRICK